MSRNAVIALGLVAAASLLCLCCLALVQAHVPTVPAEAPVGLTWGDLIGTEGVAAAPLEGIAEHGDAAAALALRQGGIRLVRAYDGRRVRLPGYVVPLQHDGQALTEFLLVPYVGACVHVPPPPANQLVYVEAGVDFESEGLFQAVMVTGIMTSSAAGGNGSRSFNGFRLDHGSGLQADTIAPVDTAG